MHEYRTYWRGKIPVQKVDWQFISQREQFLFDSLERMKNDIWKKTVEKYPDTYDGKVLTLDEFHIKQKSISMNLGFIRFSRVLTLNEVKQQPKGYGTLGIQAVIFSQDRRHILVGERSEKSMYCPLFHGLPGGILEVADTESKFEKACLREITEEVGVELKPGMDLVAILSELHGTVGVVMIIAGIIANAIDLKAPIKGNEEWTNNELSWVSVSSLNRFENNNSLEGVLFVKEEWKIHLETGTSVLW